jgi:fucose 4-O-acetylase-like acetyltransferase
VPTIRDLADRTPATRRRYVDLLRAIAIIAVVLGHWMVMTVVREPTGELTGFTALSEVSALYPLTWLFQVMPVFFFVGGISNAISWQRHRARGGTASRWLLDRSARVFPPVTALLVTIAAGSVVATWAGISTSLIAQAVHLVILPLWFLIVYLAVITLTPPMHRLHERYGLAVPLVLLAGVAVGDVLLLTTGQELLAFGNFAFAWLAVHQIGFAWEDGSLRLTRGRAVALLAVAATALVLLTVPGPYPVSMVTVPGAAIQNTGPPTLALMALAAVQLAVAGLLAEPAERWLRRPRPWRVVVGVNSMILTLFLWHMVAALGGAVLLDALGLLPPADAGSAAWWLGRVPWVLTLVVLQAGLVAVFGRIETRATARRLAARTSGAASAPAPRRAAVQAVAVRRAVTRTPVVAGAYVAAILGIFVLAWNGQGDHGPFMVPTSSLVLVFAGAAVLRLGRRGTT